MIEPKTVKKFETIPRILVVTSCTGEKQFKPSNALLKDDFQDADRLKLREAELANFMTPAGQLYTGLQHLRVMEGIQILRQVFGKDRITLAIVSAGYGLVLEEQLIAPYEVTFNSMKATEIDNWSNTLGIHVAFENLIEQYNIVFILLGEKYLRAINFPLRTRSDQTLIFLASKASKKITNDLLAKTVLLQLSNHEAKLYGYGLVGLKGFLFKQFAEYIVENPGLMSEIYGYPQSFVDLFQRKSIQPQLKLNQLTVSDQRAKYNVFDSLDNLESHLRPSKRFIPIPKVPVAANIHLGMQYFIPEWDDHVDPNYDFVNDRLTPNRDPYCDEVYAHEIYPSPNYDGLLVSKTVLDKSKNKQKKIEELGNIHAFVRYKGSIMGDCGAFSYIEEDIPPYTTQEVLDYYHYLGFNFGVSVDHLIVGDFAKNLDIRQKRYDLTLKNAQDFLEKYCQGNYMFTPIGVAQGWDPQSYADAAKELINMGYSYIALGGLARALTRDIIDILVAIRPHLCSTTRMHLFGVGRINAIPAFRHLGVTSFDSASSLRRAWLDSRENYHEMSGKTYAAIRIPQVDKNGQRIKHLLESEIINHEKLKELEVNSLNSIRSFDRGETSLESTLNTLLEYDQFLELPRDGKVDPVKQAKRLSQHNEMYRKLLEDKPWQSCGCVICKNIAVEVMIFRGNDRNRRRGFHNTYVFYKQFQEILANETLLDWIDVANNSSEESQENDICYSENSVQLSIPMQSIDSNVKIT